MPSVTQDLPGAIFFSDGEGLDFNDLNDMQSLTRRVLGDDFLRRQIFMGDEGNLRTIGGALEVVCNGTSAILIGAGAFMFKLGADPGEPDHQFLTVETALELGLTIPANAIGGDRYDIISVKVEYLSGDSESRDFEDAVTRVKSTGATDKRRNLRVTIDQTIGTVIATEPAVPAGFTKIARIQVANGTSTAVMDDVRDFRVPAGYTRMVIPITDMYGEGSWLFNPATQATWANTTATLGQFLHVPINVLQRHELRDVGISSMRLASIHFSGLINTGGGLDIIRKSNQFGVSNPLLEVTTFVTLALGGTYHQDRALLEPLWSNGRSAPNQILSDPDDQGSLSLRVRNGNAASDAVHGIAVEFWGGI